MEIAFNVIIFILQMLLWIIAGYYFIVSVFCLVGKKRSASAGEDRMRTFAVVVAAHNEENVIGELLDCLNSLDYPRELYEVFVVADNCNDLTTDIAARYGAAVLNRFDAVNRGKGFALEFAFEHIWEMDRHFDAVAVFDADNTLSPNFLTEMNKQLSQGYGAVQGYLDSKNPFDSWVTLSYSLWYWINNNLGQLARHNLNISCQLGGTGLVIRTDLLKEIGWGATCLAEDTEFTLKLALKDIKVGWANDAVVYDEKPSSMDVSYNQRLRWMQGICDVADRFVAPLLKKSFTERKLEPLHALLTFWAPTVYSGSLWAISLLAVLGLIFSGDATVGSMLLWANPISISAQLAFLALNGSLGLFVLHKDKKLSWRVLLGFGSFFVYLLTWIPVSIMGTLKKKETAWYHTPHGTKK